MRSGEGEPEATVRCGQPYQGHSRHRDSSTPVPSFFPGFLLPKESPRERLGYDKCTLSSPNILLLRSVALAQLIA